MSPYVHIRVGGDVAKPRKFQHPGRATRDGRKLGDLCDDAAPATLTDVMVADVAEFNHRIGRNLRSERTDRGLTQQQLGQRMKPPMRRNEVNAHENGRRKTTPDVLVRFSCALGRDPSWFTVDHTDDAS